MVFISPDHKALSPGGAYVRGGGWPVMKRLAEVMLKQKGLFGIS